LESDDLIGLIDALAQALDRLAAKVQTETESGRFSDFSEFSEHLKRALEAPSLEMQEAANLAIKNPKGNEVQAWLFYHLKNVSQLTLAIHEVLSRLLQSEARIPQSLL
jgi:hypothetical protein